VSKTLVMINTKMAIPENPSSAVPIGVIENWITQSRADSNATTICKQSEAATLHSPTMTAIAKFLSLLVSNGPSPPMKKRINRVNKVIYNFGIPHCHLAVATQSMKLHKQV
jgi:hypothetical protein